MRRAALAATLAALLALPTVAAASPTQESTFQDDNLLVHSDADTRARTLDRLRDLGAQRLRISVFWNVIETTPGLYDFSRYDALLQGARARGLTVNFNVTGPAPDWATGTPPAARPDLKPTWEPDPVQFEAFVRAVGAHFADVDYWSVWNEPNQAGWLTPQWTQRDGRWIEAAPARYRALLDGAWRALQATGHGGHTILVGETAPKGLKHNRGETRSVDVLRFLRRLYCLDDNLQVLRGPAAAEQGCPDGDGAAVVRDHPALFAATGFAHHPYEPLFAPAKRPTWRDWVTTGNLGDLSRFLRRAWQRYQVPLPRGGVPLYLTEFGYQTKPPDPYGVTPYEQARYVNEAEFIAYRNRAVRTLAQFLLVDDKPVGTDFGRTYQTGLVDLDGRDKPALQAYRLPIALGATRVKRGSRTRVWGIVRPGGDAAQRVRVEYRRRGTKRWRTLVTRTVRAPRHVLDVRVKVARTGALRLAWGAERSRLVGITVVRRAR